MLMFNKDNEHCNQLGFQQVYIYRLILFCHLLLHPGNSDLNYIIIGTPIWSYDSISQLCLRIFFMPTDLQYAYVLSCPHDYLPRSSFLTPEMKLFLPVITYRVCNLCFPVF